MPLRSTKASENWIVVWCSATKLHESIWGWAKKFIGRLVQGSNLTKCGLFFSIVSPAFHVLPPSMLQRLASCSIEALILILKKFLNCRYDLIVLILLLSQVLLFFSCWRTENRWCQIRRVWRVIKATVMHNSHCNHRLVCRIIVLLKQDSLGQFSRPFWNVSSSTTCTFQSLELRIQYGFIWKETMQLVSEKVEYNACQVYIITRLQFPAKLTNVTLMSSLFLFFDPLNVF